MQSATRSTTRRARRTSPTTGGWLGLIILAFLAGVGAIAAIAVVGVFASFASDPTLPDPKTMTDVGPARAIDHLRPDRQGRARALRRRQAPGRDVRSRSRRSCSTRRRPSRTRPSGRTRVRPAGHHLGHARLLPRQQPRRLDDHPAARPSQAPAVRSRPGPEPDRGTQGQGDHPVDPGDAGVPRRAGQAGHHHGLPEPELLRQPELRGEVGGRELLRHPARPDHPGPGRDHRRAPEVPVELRPGPQRHRAVQVHRRGGR